MAQAATAAPTTPALAAGCQACNLRFASAAELRAHYQTDFHVANVKLRVEGQAKLSAAEYRRQVAADGDEGTKSVFACKLCKKTFHSVQTLQSHIKSTEHLMRKEQRIIERDSAAGSALTSTSLGSAALGLHRRHRAHMRERLRMKAALNSGESLAADASVGDAAAAPRRPKVSFDDRDADVTEARCLFCGLPSKTMRSNLKHMFEVHEFSVPLPHRVKDMRALLQYLSRKVNGLMCLVCGDKTKRVDSLDALRDHMAAANHERLVLSSEYAAFYEGAIDDGDAAVIPTIDDGSAALVVRGDARKRITKKDDTAPCMRKVYETGTQAEQRKLLTAAGAQETQILLKERRQDTQKARTKHFKTMNLFYNRKKYFDLKVGIKKLHAKGYDGEGEMA